MEFIVSHRIKGRQKIRFRRIVFEGFFFGPQKHEVTEGKIIVEKT